MKKKNKGQLCIILGMICSLLFMAPLYITIFGGPIDQEWLTLSIAPGSLACALIICGNYIESLEDQLSTMSQTK